MSLGIEPPPPPPSRAPKRGSSTAGYVILALVLGMGLGGACSTCLAGANSQGEEIVLGSKERVGVIDLTGVISDATDFCRQIRELSKRGDLRAIVVRIESPGGAVAPSQEIFSSMRRASKDKPIVASMGNVAASGGFWSAMGADYVFASPGSVTGSIGVITEIPDLRGIADLVRFKVRVFKSGPLKDVGNPLREMTQEDIELFTGLIQDIYTQFVGVVAERRKMDLAAVKKIADGRVLTGRAALEAGLIDELGGLEDAARKAVLLADARKAEKDGKPPPTTKLTDEIEVPTLVYPKKPLPGLLRLLSESARSAVAGGIERGVDRAAERAEERFESGARIELR
jgi:protease IV